MKTFAKRFLLGLAVVAALVGSLSFQTQDASAKTRVLRSDDGKLMLVCVYDDDTGELAYCDVYWLGLTGGNAGVLDSGSATGGTRLPADQIAVAGNALVIDGGFIAGAPDDQQVTVKPSKKGKHGHRNGGRNRR